MGGKQGAAIRVACFVERVFNTPTTMVLYLDPYDRVFRCKNNGILERYVPYDPRNPHAELPFDAKGYFNVERTGQDNHVLKTVIGQERH